MVNFKLSIRKRRPQTHPELIGPIMGQCFNPACIGQICSAVIVARDRCKICVHNAGQNIGIARAPFIVVTMAFIRPLNIDIGGKGMGTGLWPAFACNQIAGVFTWIHPQLAHNRALVTDQPFIINLIIFRMAIRDDAIPQFDPRWRSIDAHIRVGRR